VRTGTDARPTLGRRGEEAALDLYRRTGYRTVVRNWRCPLGEIDLIVIRGGVLVVCEVKARSGAAFGGGYEAVTWSKRRKLRQLASAFLASGTAPAHQDVRFDVASVWLGPRGPDVELFVDAF
jgi:putative endonuclease